jgi:Ca2+-binding RTX toxin-like protein
VVTYARSNVAISSGLAWEAVTQLSVLSTSSMAVRLQNADGTITEVVGVGFAFDSSSNATAGTVISLRRLSPDGTTWLESISGLNHSLVSLFANISSPSPFLLAANDWLAGGSLADKLSGFAGNDTLSGGAGADALDGGAGIDAASYAGSAAAVTVNLATGAASGGHAAGDTFTSIENLIGSAYADTLIGNAGNNLLAGGDGNDTLTGWTGADALNGGTGTDAASYAGSDAGVTVNLAAGTASGGHAAGDTFTSIENLVGSAHADALTGNAGNNALNGWLGNDTLLGGGGNDALAGGDGDDILTGGAGVDVLGGGAGLDAASYATSAAGVTINLLTGAATGGDAAGDTFAGIEDLIGSDHPDTLTGNAGDNWLIGGTGGDTLYGGGGLDILDGDAGSDTLLGGDGADTLTGGAAGDTLDGGAGFDAASYGASSAGVMVNLATGAAAGGDADGDTLTGIEDLIGSDHADTLTGDAGDNWLTGGAGTDALHGGGGFDAASYVSSAAGVTVNLLTGTASGGDAAGDTLTDIEDLVGSDYGDTLTGDAGDNVLYGGLGDDVLTGGAWFDSFIFDTAPGAGNVDQITDFSAADDSVWLDRAQFSALASTGSLAATAFRVGAAAGDADDRVIYDDSSGALYYDADGTGGIGQVQFATLVSHPGGLTPADFIVI